MAIDTSATSAAPYHDDWSSSGNSAKNYLRILFQPGRSVQVRELNQMQSGIQAQIDKFGQHIFKDGSRVLDGEIDTDNRVQWVDLTLSANGVTVASDSSRPLVGKTLFADTSLTSYDSPNPPNIDVAATIMDYELISGSKYRFYLRYSSEDTNFNDGVRTDADVRVAENVLDSGGSTIVAANAIIGSGSTALETGYALKIHNNKGVYYAKGYFVEVAEQTKYIDANKTDGPRNDFSGNIGFTITESIRTAVNDSTLYDNAQGTPNFSAPGADRYVITLGLCFITDDTNIRNSESPAHVVATTTANVIEVVPVVEAEPSQPVETKYNKLGDTLAKRTFEESGDYSLQPFQLELREHLDTGFNRGKYLSGVNDPEGNPASSAKMIAALEPSIAYVKGYRIEILKKQEIITDKARETQTRENITVQAVQGSYIELDTIANLPKPDANAASSNTIYTIKDNNSDSSINSGNPVTIATCFCRGIEKVGRKFRFYVSPTSSGGRDLTMVSGKVLSEGRTITGDRAGASGTFTGTSNTGMILKDVGNRALLFPVGFSTIKTLSQNSGTISVPVKVTQEITSSGTSVVLDTLSGSDKYYHDNPGEYIITKNSDGSVVEATAVTFSSNNLNATLTIPNISNAVVNVTCSKRSQISAKTKTKQTITNETIGSATDDYVVGQKINLTKTDVISYSSIVNQSGADISSHFDLSTGQTDVGYEVGFLTCIKALENTQIIITYNHFEHSDTGNDAFWVDSYANLDGTSGVGTSLARAEVGFHNGLNLTDVLDFRGTQTAIDPNGVIEFTKVENFLPRLDKIVLKSNGELEYLKGDSNTNMPPKTPEDSMVLYDLNVPAYTDSVQQIEVGYKDNRRYTMRDIGKIETRVRNLEYYSSLSLLEKMTSDAKILDDNTQADRFKNGIVVDEFKSHGVGNPRDPGYAVSIEPEVGILRPSFSSTNVAITNLSNTAKDKSNGSTDDPNPINHGEGEDFIRLPSTSIRELIKQPFASVAVSVNPFDVASWVGDIKLSPESDEWRDTTRRPEVIIQQDGNADALLNIANEQLASQGTRWNDWETTWSGVTETENLGWVGVGNIQDVVAGSQVNSRSFRTGTNRVTGGGGYGGRWAGNAQTQRNNRRTVITSSSVPTFGGGTISGQNQRAQFRVERRTTSTAQIRQGVQQFARLETQTESLGDKIVDVSFVPFIRSRKLYFRATGLKPNTEFIPFFDNVDVTQYCKTATFKEYRNETDFVDHTNDSPGNISHNTLKTNKVGAVSGYLIIPNSDKLRFRTGTREFLLVDNPTNKTSFADKTPDVLLPLSHAFAKAEYNARGVLETVQEQIKSTRRVVIDERRVTDRRTLTTTETAAAAVRHRDPVAQTFVVDPDLNPNGVFLHDIDIFFSKLHTDLPVHFHIVTAENGIPTQEIIPFSRVTKYPTRVAALLAGAAKITDSNAEKDRHVAVADTGAATATKMVFEAPVFLKPGVEYAFVLLSNSPDYMVWHSEVGGVDITAGAGGKVIVKNPYTGVALKSANASTWTPDQTKDIKFTMNYMRFFETSGGSKDIQVGSGETDSGFSTFTTRFASTVSLSNPLKVDAITLNSTDITLPKTGIVYTLDINDGLDTRTYFMTPGKVMPLPDTVSFSSSTQLVLKTRLLSEHRDLTPVIDVTRLSLLLFKNNINGGSTIEAEGDAGGNETRETHGSALARYITKPINLANSASQLNVFVDIDRPLPRCGVDVYARFDDATGTDSYIKLEGGEIPVGSGFSEVQFRTSANSDTERQFSKFQIKIVLRAIDDGFASVVKSDDSGYELGTDGTSENTATVPQIRNFRAIATA